LGFDLGNGVGLGDAKALYYSAGPNKEFDGVFGRINVVSTSDEQQKKAQKAQKVILRGAL